MLRGMKIALTPQPPLPARLFQEMVSDQQK